MAFHHALAMLEPKARATLCYFMQTTFALFEQQWTELQKTYANARQKHRKIAKDLKQKCDDCAMQMSELTLSNVNAEAVDKYAEEFLPEGEHKDFVAIVRTLSCWRHRPDVVKRAGRQKATLDIYTNAAMTFCLERLPAKVLLDFDEEELLDYNYALCAVLASERQPETIDEERMVDPTWHPLSVGRFAIPLPTHETIVGTIQSLADDEKLYLKTLFHDLKASMTEKGYTVDSVCDALAGRYPGPLGDCFRGVCTSFEEGLGGDDESVRDLTVKLVETSRMPDIILRLRAQMIFMEPTTFPWPLTAPVKVLGLVMNLLFDQEGESVAAGLLMALLDTEATKDDIYLHYKHPLTENDMFDDLVESLPPDILVPTMLSVELLLPYLRRVFTTEGMAELKRKSQGRLLEVCPIFQAEDRIVLTSQLGLGLAKAAFGFRQAHPTLMPDLADKAVVRQMLLKLPDYFSYITGMPKPVDRAVSPADDYYGVLLLWLFAADTIPALLKKGWLTVEDDNLETLNFLFRLIVQILKKMENKNQPSDSHAWEAQLSANLGYVEKDLDENEKAVRAEKAKKAMQAGFLDDEVPEGTIFN